jgi:enoyl-CoA hydratase/carnithine racemase
LRAIFFTFSGAPNHVDYQTILVAKDGPVTVVTLNRPDALNALNRQMASELVGVLSVLATAESVRCVILTGSDKAFCAGADIKEMSGLSTEDMIREEHFRALWDKAGTFPKPMIAALSGYALGGGLELAMCCDIIVASQGTKLGQPEINIGIIPGGGGTQRLTRAVGKYRAMEMILTGTSVTAEQAEAAGLVNRVVPLGKQLDEAKKMGHIIASKGPLALKLAKMAIRRAQETGLSDGLEYERQLFYALFATKDKEEGMKAFLEKRRPEFKGE